MHEADLYNVRWLDAVSDEEHAAVMQVLFRNYAIWHGGEPLESDCS